MSAPSSAGGRQLWELLPEVYRTRDDGSLAGYLDACGTLLDRVRATLEQRLADAFPDTPEAGAAAQGWLLPYFADLFDVRLSSPHRAGRHEEVSRAVAWRQRKGTARAVEEIAEAVGQLEVEVQEGWRRVAVTPRLGAALPPAAAFGLAAAPDPDDPAAAARHPGLPAATVDLRPGPEGLPSRAVRADAVHPQARTSRFAGRRVAWRPGHRHGAPCFPGSYEDASRRTPDLRTPTWRAGHHHPRRVLLFVPPPTGFFPPGAVSLAWGDRHQPEHADRLRDETGDDGTRRVFAPRPRDQGGPAVHVTTAPPAFDGPVEVADLVFLDTLRVAAGGRIVLRRVAARRLIVAGADADDPAGTPVVDAADCLFDEIEAEAGLVLLEHSTVMRRLACRRLLASDCLIAGELALAGQPGDPAGCARFTRLPPGAPGSGVLRRAAVTAAEPVFFDFPFCAGGASRRVAAFGDPAYGALHPATPERIAAGAEDGGEMGAYHHRHHRRAAAAVAEKLRDFLPVGIEAVLVPDARLLVPPPAVAGP